MGHNPYTHILTYSKICANPNCKEENPQPLENFHRNKNKSDGHMNQCKSCRKEYKNNPENTAKIKANAAVSSAVQSGILPHISSLICVFCSKKARNYHHHSYDKQYRLSVIPVCLLCHKRLHLEND